MVDTALMELHFILNFNQAVTANLAMSVGALTDLAFIDLANVTLLCRDTYLEHVKRGIKVNTFRDLKRLLFRVTIFPGPLVRRAEEEIISFNSY